MRSVALLLSLVTVEASLGMSLLQLNATASRRRRRGGNGLCATSDKNNYHAWCTQWISPAQVNPNRMHDSHWCHVTRSSEYQCKTQDQWRFCMTKYEGNMARLFGKDSEEKLNPWAK